MTIHDLARACGMDFFEIAMGFAFTMCGAFLVLLCALIITSIFDIRSGRQVKWDAERALRKRAGLH